MKKLAKQILMFTPLRVARSVLFFYRFFRYKLFSRFLKSGYFIQGQDFECFKKIKVDNIQFYIRVNSKNGYIDRYIYDNSEWEPKISFLLHQLYTTINGKSLFIDVGANIGYHSLFAARLGYDVIAFEPIKKIHDQFLLSIGKNNLAHSISLFNCALSNTEGCAKIYYNPDNMGNSSMLSDLDLQRGGEHVKLCKLDDRLDLGVHKSNYDLMLIKIDVEGYEMEVLEGGESFIKAHKPFIIFEFSPAFYGSIDRSIKILQLLKSWGYDIYDMSDNLLLDPRHFYKFSKKKFYFLEQSDLLAVPEEFKKSEFFLS